ncbi:MAG: hypothetical protein HY331_01670 [Chloroflexi bacterium]|nr:hypothetical protein [Chloroflexota bacterium]
MLKRFGVVPMAHYRLASTARGHRVGDLHGRVLWGMFTGASSYRDLLRMALNPHLVARLALALGRATFERSVQPTPAVR